MYLYTTIFCSKEASWLHWWYSVRFASCMSHLTLCTPLPKSRLWVCLLFYILFIWLRCYPCNQIWCYTVGQVMLQSSIFGYNLPFEIHIKGANKSLGLVTCLVIICFLFIHYNNVFKAVSVVLCLTWHKWLTTLILCPIMIYQVDKQALIGCCFCQFHNWASD